MRCSVTVYIKKQTEEAVGVMKKPAANAARLMFGCLAT